MTSRVLTVVFLAALLAVVAVVGWSLAGPVGVVVASLGGASYFLGAPRLSSTRLLRASGARELAFHERGLRGLVAELARRAGLPVAPRLFVLRSPDCNAFAVGDRHDPALTVTTGLLDLLGGRQLAGVLAHEIAHLRHGDVQLMGVARTATELTRWMALFGTWLLVLNLPLLVFLGRGAPWLAVLLLLAAPTVSRLLELALSRTREFAADLEASRLTGDPHGLASALAGLADLERRRDARWRWLGGRPVEPVPVILRSHPPARERVRRLCRLSSPVLSASRGWSEARYSRRPA